MAVWGWMEGKAYNLVSVYAPLQLQKKMLAELSDVIIGLPQGTTIIGGDFNALLHRDLDSSTGMPGGVTKGEGYLHKWLDSLGLCDVWRTWNPTNSVHTHTRLRHIIPTLV